MKLDIKVKKFLRDFTLEVDFSVRDEVFALLGASGSGKSMTLKIIAGIEKPDEGRIILNGRTLFDSERHICLPPQARRIGYLFQNSALFPNMTVAENISKLRENLTLKLYGAAIFVSHDRNEVFRPADARRLTADGLPKHFPVARISGNTFRANRRAPNVSAQRG